MHTFVALLEYVSKTHENEIRPSIFVTIISKPIAQISFMFGCWDTFRIV